jgi:hypothetical protein
MESEGLREQWAGGKSIGLEMLHVVEIFIDYHRQLNFNGVVNISQENCNVWMSQLYFLMLLSEMYRIVVFILIVQI